MNNRISKLLATALITAMVLSVIPLFNIMPARAAAPLPPSMYLVPEFPTFYTNTTNIGDTFVVTLWAQALTGAFTMSFEVDFNIAQLSCVSAVFTAGGGSQWFTLRQNSTGGWHLPPAQITIAFPPTISNVLGTITGGESCLNPDSIPGGTSGTIITMTFQIIAGPPINGNLTSLIHLNPDNTWFSDEVNNAIPINLGDARYTYIWSPPPKPHLAVEPTPQTFSMFLVWNGSTFTEDIVIKSISNGWFLGNATTDLTYNATLTTVAGVVFDPIWTGATTWTGNNTGTLSFYVDGPSSIPNGDVKIATITFRIIGQGYVPPRAFGDFDVSTLHLLNYQLGSTFGFYIAMNPAVDGLVTVYAFSPVLPPHLEVSSATIGPGPSLGQLFNITVSLVDVMDFQNIIGIQFRLGYDPTMLEAVAVYEGPFLPTYAALQGAAFTGTFFVGYINNPDGIFGPHVLIGNMIFPNGTGRWNPPMLNGTGVVATITFRVLYQSFGEPNVVTHLDIVDKLAIGLDNLEDQNIIDKALQPSINGTVTITTNLPGRMIDEYGGAVNSGLGPLVGTYLQFPAPYGGQGPNAPMDLVEPQSWVWLHANVTYNYWPVQFKNVAFEIQMPNGTVYTKLSAFTDENGVATVGFRMPWPCDINTTSSSLIGVWKEISTVQLADVKINDTLTWHYDYLVHVWKVTTDMFQYNHGQCVQITFEYGSHAQQYYPALFVVSIVDELGVTVGIATVTTTFGGTVFCQYKNSSETVEICLPKWAYAGIATIHINTFDFEPSQGGVAIAPEFVGPTIAIQPY